MDELEQFTGGQHFDKSTAELANSQTAAGREAQAAKETELPDIVINRFKCRQYLEGMNAEEGIRGKRDELLSLYDEQEEPRERVYLGGLFKIRDGQAIADYHSARERILWALIGHLSLELSDVSCDKQAAEIQADFAKQAINMQRKYAEFRNFFLEHFPRLISQNEVTGRDLFDLAKEIMLRIKAED